VCLRATRSTGTGKQFVMRGSGVRVPSSAPSCLFAEKVRNTLATSTGNNCIENATRALGSRFLRTGAPFSRIRRTYALLQPRFWGNGLRPPGAAGFPAPNRGVYGCNISPRYRRSLQFYASSKRSRFWVSTLFIVSSQCPARIQGGWRGPNHGTAFVRKAFRGRKRP